MNSDTFTALAVGTPTPRKGGGIRGGSKKTRFYRDQLQANPGMWFVWRQNSRHGSDTGQALRTLTGNQSLTGVDRSTLDYESTARKQENGTYTTFVRYVGKSENGNFQPLSADPVVNPFG